MHQVLLVVQVLIAVALIGVILIQRSDTDGFGLGSGSGMNLLSGRAAANLLTRTTAVLAALFIINSLALSIIAANSSHRSIVDQIDQTNGSAPAIPLAVEKDKQTNTVMPVINTKPDAAPIQKVPAVPETKKAPAVPTE